MKDGDLAIELIQATLWKIFRERRGSIDRVEKALGKAEGYFRWWRKHGDLKLSSLLPALRQLDVDYADFFAEALATPLEPHERPGRPTKISRLALKRYEELGSGESRGQLTEDDEARLRELDELRDSSFRKAEIEAHRALREADKQALVPRLLAIYGSARRAAGKLDEALDNQLHALKLFKKAKDRAACGDVRQRIGSVHAYGGKLELALWFDERAYLDHSIAKNPRGCGRSLVDQGARLYHLDRFDEAIERFEPALELLPADEHRHRFSALLTSALCYRKLQKREKADAEAERAHKLLQHVGPALAGNLLFFRAEVAEELGFYERTESLYGEAYEIYCSASPIDAALSAVAVVRAQMCQGKEGEATETAKAMGSLLQPLNRNPLACAAIMELLRVVVANRRITAALLSRVEQKPKSARAQINPAPASSTI